MSEMADFQNNFVTSPLKSNLLNRGIIEPEPEMTMMEAVPYFAENEINEAELILKQENKSNGQLCS